MRIYDYPLYIDLRYVLLASISFFLLNVVLSFRLYKIVNILGCRTSYLRSLESHLGGMLLSDFTPGKSGYLTTPLILKRIAGCNTKLGMASILVPQAIEFLIKIFGALLALILLYTSSTHFKDLLLVAGIGIGMLFAISIIILVASWSERVKIPGFLKKFEVIFQGYFEHSVKTKDYILLLSSISIIGWFITAIQWYLIGEALNIELSFIHYFLLQPLVSALMFVPITPAGIGIMESGAIAAFYLLGVGTSPAFFFSILVRVSMILGDVGGVIPLTKVPLKSPKEEET
ncbi:MAG: lysylphosphatidylglycerol synthase transmembrane domain-containing protein [Archaeoglobaceae archaeon]